MAREWKNGAEGMAFASFKNKTENKSNQNPDTASCEEHTAKHRKSHVCYSQGGDPSDGGSTQYIGFPEHLGIKVS